MTPADLPIRDAATVIVLDRDRAEGPSVLMGQRGARAAFMPSKYVFPGGAIDPEDALVRFALPLADRERERLSAGARSTPMPLPETIAAAALRELAEETGLMAGRPGEAPAHWQHYKEAGLAPDPSGLFYIFRAVTPPGRTRRFDARFLLIEADKLHGDRDDFSAACDELSHLHWVPLTLARDLDLPFITEVVLAEVAALSRAPGPIKGPNAVPFLDSDNGQPRFHHLR